MAVQLLNLEVLMGAERAVQVESHHNVMIADRETSESIRQQFVGRIQSNARLLELMGKVGKVSPLSGVPERSQFGFNGWG